MAVILSAAKNLNREMLRCAQHDASPFVWRPTSRPESLYSLQYLVGVLNSKALRFYYETAFPTLHVQSSELEVLPICLINFSDPTDKARHDRIVEMVDEMLRLQKEHAVAEREMFNERHELKRKIDALDTSIDALVYELYGLTEEEIKIVEGGAA
jgi:hypothetical protein